MFCFVLTQHRGTVYREKSTGDYCNLKCLLQKCFSEKNGRKIFAIAGLVSRVFKVSSLLRLVISSSYLPALASGVLGL